MNFKQMFQMQKELDERIRNEHKLMNVNLIDEKILAFQVELGELANETRCFKYWSLKQASPKEVILEEYVDGIHFLLSIGIDLQTVDISVEDQENEGNLTKQFSMIYEQSSQLARTKVKKEFIELFQQYWFLGTLLNFTSTEIEAAYIGKNEVNHQRQNQGY
ncbi:MAG: dUTP diphosphatase [Anaerobacillus sp.]|uniref:dUTP diphosphatase n=1 Tax=Anaerobacillus sp. TaxID=1872506 RepID=UPI00391BBD63